MTDGAAERRRWRWQDSIVVAIAWRYLAHSAMVAIALWNERRPAPTLPDAVLAVVPKVIWIANWNFWLWLAAWVPLAIWLLIRDRRAGVSFLWLGGWISLVRALTIPLTGLGPVEGPDVNAGASTEALVAAFWAIVNPISALTTDAPHLWLTKDLFFSGHVATTFLLWLYCRKLRWLGPLALVAHVATTAVVLLAHLHYTIDLVGAWAITFAAYVLYEGWTGRTGGTPVQRSSVEKSSVRFTGFVT